MATITLHQPPYVVAGAAIAGRKEGEGPLAAYYDRIIDDDLYGEQTWEKAECRLFYETCALCLQKAGLTAEGTDLLLGGDLLNQIISASMAAR